MLREIHTAAFYSTAKLLDKVKKVKRYLKAHIKVSIISNAVKARKWPEKNHQDRRNHNGCQDKTQTKQKWRFYRVLQSKLHSCSLCRAEALLLHTLL